ncbi:cytochrome ubiquinol oxidase subunit I [Acinetobacter gyllenbergii]|jgi:cytochrome bd ubiquinol oxidase subunit I|uniref:Cytochrome d ubiquinol oxidase subunit I n=1 Tax=Acinetobacter gyllenbergii CIP 110306 = MTCC 11365 TaxID=1217657 RepID=A0A829HJ73_9GAMM|nr:MULTISPECIES: cytochrome ubiquinol oxidase subunit I [Acinetobacter]EPF90597.1 cytochrome d ubiquinol oxidase subunit I [Acinetobacter gyllenbergii CIP 110306 = MTCC 11365]EPH33907.1 putative Cytochrome bd2, subunit I [Acinetobacter gyllenbergii CIP 110306 = MTCC 11365]MCU4377172.1 cytochrome ubiquinol oxidase subunit I [Acinetobacter haemolyticus]MEB3792757.1 cytochrome ubiquinol oxidase subunit I [Acinetobacter sp. IK40]NNP69014.1 cytochrome D ubiquinol oxidase subunit I [Acinetobacter sp
MNLGLTALELARIQFAFTVSFHIIFPAISIGLASFLAVLEWRWLKTNDPIYKDLFKYWVKIFAVAFGMGVVSGVVMSYQFGTNWSEFSRFAGGVTGPLLAYEVLSAFFLEAGFLGIMLFGWGRVGKKAHFFATLMVAVGTCISMFWILSSNSWMQTPQGFTIENGIVVPQDWFAIVFNPSFPYRLAHMAIAAFMVAALLVASTAAWHLLKGRRDELVKKSFSMALWLILILAPLQVFVGDAHGLNTLKHQPAKLAAMEGHWETNYDEGMPLYLFGIPDMQEERTKYAIAIPNLGSLILTHSMDGTVKGLKDFAPEDRPNSTIVFWSFRIMVGLGMLMLLLAAMGLWLRKTGKFYENKWFHRFALIMGPSGFIALLAGWFTTEVGRQPWVVYGVMRTKDALSPVSAEQVGLTLIIFVVVYCIVFGVGIYYMLKLMHKGPEFIDSKAEQVGGVGHFKTPMRPLSAADEKIDDRDQGASS